MREKIRTKNILEGIFKRRKKKKCLIKS